jgi:hypothetical protein
LKIDNYYFAPLSNSFVPETGTVPILDSWLEFDLSFSSRKLQDSDRLALNLEKFIPSAVSFYNFLFLNVFIDKKFTFDGDLAAYLKFEGGYLLEDGGVPMWQIYRLGGYERMMGYNYDEFEGHYMNFFRIKFEAPVMENINAEISWIRLDGIRLFTAFDMGSAGDARQISSLSNYYYSAGLGIIIEFTFRHRTPVKMTFAVAQALKQGKVPVFYFVHEF